MADVWEVFVGPYAEWTLAGSAFEAEDPRGDDPRWSALYDGSSLWWNIGHNYGLAHRGGQLVEIPCCAPGQPRDGCPRWPMAVKQCCEELFGAEAVTDWTGVDPRAEVRWFAAAFAAELALAEELAGHAPTLRWGLLWIVR
jgi:hypothetical protein